MNSSRHKKSLSKKKIAVDIKKQIEIIKRGTAEIISEDGLRDKLK